MDFTTIQAYNQNSGTLFSKYSQNDDGISKYFQIAFGTKKTILDIGSGSGKDLNLLAQLGFEVSGVEPSSEMRNLSINKYPEFAGKIISDKLPELNTVSGKFDCILCSAVLMHIPQIQLFDSIISIKNHLCENGNLLISIPHYYPGIDEKTSRDKLGRLYNGVTADQLILLFERLGFRLLNKWVDNVSMESQEIIWVSILLNLNSGDKIRPLDSIESILNKDQKVATYKLALFKALAETAVQNPKSVLWMPDGNVKLRIDVIIEKWIEYYWSIFENEDFIPQIQKESPTYPKKVAFRQILTYLTKKYKFSGGLEGFVIDRTRLKIQPNAQEDYTRVKRIIKSTLIDGPIKHSGGYNSPNKMFQYDNKGYVIIPGMIWRELTLLGYWIVDSTIIRWAELSSKFAHGIIKPSQVIDLLIIEESNRRIDEVRRHYNQDSTIKCVWTSKIINELEIDHIIPFSLWKNNDLWNLVPSNRSINRDKSDKLVSFNHLNHSKDNIIFSWKKSLQIDEIRFYNEARILTGHSLNRRNWENSLFAGLAEAIECTAIQRGIVRWEPKINPLPRPLPCHHFDPDPTSQREGRSG